MSEGIQAKRRFDKIKDWTLALPLAAGMALVISLIIELVALFIGMVLGDVTWHRGWVGHYIDKVVDGLNALSFGGWLTIPLQNLNKWLSPNLVVRDLFALGSLTFPFLLIAAKRIGPVLISRYDNETLRPFSSTDIGLRWAGPLGEHQQRAWDQLHEWCFEGAGSGASPRLRPWVMPAVEKRLSIAVLTGANGVGKTHLAEALGLKLDGSLLLQACKSKIARLRLRLQTKLHDCLWWRPRQPDDPWDSGYLVEDAALRKQLAQFLPRRATLIVSDELPSAALRQCVSDLSARRAEFRHPVRLLIIDSIVPSTLELNSDSTRSVWTTDVQEMGEVPIIDLSHGSFEVPRFRALGMMLSI